MHEQSLMRGVVNKILETGERAGGGRVVAARLWLGCLSQMSPAHVAEHFHQAAAGGPLAGITLSFTQSDDPLDPRAQDVVLESVELAATPSVG